MTIDHPNAKCTLNVLDCVFQLFLHMFIVYIYTVVDTADKEPDECIVLSGIFDEGLQKVDVEECERREKDLFPRWEGDDGGGCGRGRR
jgi:hypothetical protein